MTTTSKALRDEQIYELADTLYWQILNVLDIEHICIEVNNDGTRNTELGRELYYTIEQTIQDFGMENDDDEVTEQELELQHLQRTG